MVSQIDGLDAKNGSTIFEKMENLVLKKTPRLFDPMKPGGREQENLSRS